MARGRIASRIRDLVVVLLVLAGMGIGSAIVLRAQAPGLAGVGILIASQVAAVMAFGADRGLSKVASPLDRNAMVEGITLGSLSAFVISLAIETRAGLPRSLVLLDWTALVATISAFRWFWPGETRMRRHEAEPDVAAAFHGRVVLLAGGDAGHRREIIRQVRDFEPKTLIVSGEIRGARRRDPLLVRIPMDFLNQSSVREVFAAHRPDVVLFAQGPGDAARSVALRTRRVIAEALRAGVDTFVLIGPDGDSDSPRLAERIVKALTGLTRSRLLRVRIGEGVPPSEVATRLLRISAKGRDGALITLGRSGGMRVEAPLDGAGDAEELWAELDRLEKGK